MSALPAILGDEVRIENGGDPVFLKPTLRAALDASKLHGDLSRLAQKVEEIDTRTIRRLLEIGSGQERTVGLLLYMRDAAGYAELCPYLFDYIAILANGGIRPAVQTDGEPSGDAGGMSFDTYLARLFKIGVGWLSWSIEDTLAAPMPAIVSGFAGRQDMLRAIFGGGDAPTNTIPLDEKVRIAASHFVSRKVQRPRRAEG